MSQITYTDFMAAIGELMAQAIDIEIRTEPYFKPLTDLIHLIRADCKVCSFALVATDRFCGGCGRFLEEMDFYVE